MIRPVAVFARDLASARAFAVREGLKTREWLFVRSRGQVRYVPLSSVAILPDFIENRSYADLAALAGDLEGEAGPYVPVTAHAPKG